MNVRVSNVGILLLRPRNTAMDSLEFQKRKLLFVK